MTHLRLPIFGLTTLLLVLLSAPFSQAATINVSAGQSIQAAINSALSGDVVVVATGTYKENLDFKGKAITVRSSNPASAALVAATILDGAKNGSVVTFKSGETATSVLTGFTITNGSGTLAQNDAFYGGGVYCLSSSPTLTNNAIRNNSAGFGGGVFCRYSSLSLTSNAISGNTATSDGGGVCCFYSPLPTVANNTISGNSAIIGGGGVFCDTASPSLTSNTISGNEAYWGGGIFCQWNSSPTLTNNTISGNSATDSTGGCGGGIYCYANSSPTLTNNTMSGNSAAYGGGVYCLKASSPVIKNTIIALSSKGGGLYVDTTQYPAYPPNPVLTHCDVNGNTGGNFVNMADPTGTNGNISIDPLFANAAGSDFRLKSPGGRWNGTAWVVDAVSSPCIDAGDPTSAFNLEPAPNGGRINMGYDGNTAYASKTASANPAPTVAIWGPKGDAVGVTANINITFSEAMVRPTAQGAMFINGVKVSTSSAFGGKFTWLAKKMTFNPTHDLLPGTTYRIVIGKAARSRAGVCMAKGFSYEFTTRGAPPAAVTVAAAPTAFGAQIITNLTAAADVTVSIRNLAGREVAVLTPGRLEAGVHSLLWNGKSATGTKAPAGMYLVQVTARSADGASCSAVASLRK